MKFFITITPFFKLRIKVFIKIIFKKNTTSKCLFKMIN